MDTSSQPSSGKAGIIACLCGVYLVVLCIAYFISMQLAVYAHTQPLGKSIPDRFPVLVISGNQAKIVYYGALPYYLNTLPESSLQVPEGRVNELNRQLKAQEREIFADPHSPFAAGNFSVTRYADGRQLLKVSGTWDDDRENIGWYIADMHGIMPLKQVSYFGPRVAMMCIPIALFIAALVTKSVGILLRKLRESPDYRMSGLDKAVVIGSAAVILIAPLKVIASSYVTLHYSGKQPVMINTDLLAASVGNQQTDVAGQFPVQPGQANPAGPQAPTYLRPTPWQVDGRFVPRRRVVVLPNPSPSQGAAVDQRRVFDTSSLKVTGAAIGGVVQTENGPGQKWELSVYNPDNIPHSFVALITSSDQSSGAKRVIRLRRLNPAVPRATTTYEGSIPADPARPLSSEGIQVELQPMSSEVAAPAQPIN